jgi:hypothetical protein
MLGVPVLVLLIREKTAAPMERRAGDPASLHVLEVGNIEASLAQL